MAETRELIGFPKDITGYHKEIAIRFLLDYLSPEVLIYQETFDFEKLINLVNAFKFDVPFSQNVQVIALVERVLEWVQPTYRLKFFDENDPDFKKHMYEKELVLRMFSKMKKIRDSLQADDLKLYTLNSL